MRRTAALVLVAAAAAVSGCGLGQGKVQGGSGVRLDGARDFGGKRLPTRLECTSPTSPECKEVQRRLTSEGVIVSGAPFGSGAGADAIRVVVGPWGTVRQVKAAAALEQGPSNTGVYARYGGGGTL